MDLLQEYKELYYKEIEHSDRLNNKSNISISFVTVLGSAQILLWSQLKLFELTWYSIIYFIGCIISLVFFIKCAYKFYYTYSGYDYSYFPIEDMVAATIKTYEIAGNAKKEIKRADKHVYNMYCERFLNDAISNRTTNVTKNNNHKKLLKFICISFIITGIVFASSIFIDYYEEKYINQDVIHIIIDGGEIYAKW